MSEEQDENGDPYLTTKWKLHMLHHVIRFILNIFAVGMIAKGYGTKEYWNHIVAGALVVGTLAWAVYSQWEKRKIQSTIKDTDTNEHT